MPDSLVKRVAVLGAGTMGSQIAALLASKGIACDLLDLPAEEYIVYAATAIRLLLP